MISGKDKTFTKGKSFKFPKFEKLSDNRKGRPCPKCLIYRKNENFTEKDGECRLCKRRNIK